MERAAKTGAPAMIAVVARRATIAFVAAPPLELNYDITPLRRWPGSEFAAARLERSRGRLTGADAFARPRHLAHERDGSRSAG
jgi:hypothetical protein